MENDANQETGHGQRVPQLRTILISVAVSSLSISRLLNITTRNNLTIMIGGGRSSNDLKKLHYATQISYVAVGILTFVVYAWLFERYRRKTLLYSVCISQVATSVIQLRTNSYRMLLVSIASSAISDVGAVMFCVIYVSEIAPDEIRGALVAIPQLFFSFSQFAYVFANLVPYHSMDEYSPCISMYVSAFVSMVAYIAVPESPIYLLRKDDIAGAKHSLTFLHGKVQTVSCVIANRSKILKSTRSDSQTSTSVFQECISRRAVTCTCMMIALIFTSSILLDLEPHLNNALKNWEYTGTHFVKFTTFFVRVVAILLGLVLCDRIGRKSLLLISLFLCFITLIGSGITFWVNTNAVRNQTVPLYESTTHSVVFWCMYTVILNLGVSFLPEVIMTDIFPPKILNIQMVILGSFQLCVDYVLLSFIAVVEYPYTIHKFWLYGGLAFVVALLMTKFLPETKCRPPGFTFMDSEERVLYSSLQEVEE